MDALSTHHIARPWHPQKMTPPTHHLASWRKRFKLTQAGLATRVGTEKSAISKLETGVNRFDYEWRERIAKVLGITPDDLLRSPGDVNPSGKNLSQSGLPEEKGSPGKEEKEVLSVTRLLEDLVQEYGPDVVRKAFVRAMKAVDTASHPHQRRRTS
jgi:transcriptional regulator with XRE-family HTH domain